MVWPFLLVLGRRLLVKGARVYWSRNVGLKRVFLDRGTRRSKSAFSVLKARTMATESNHRLILKWESHRSSLLTAFQDNLENEEHLDVALIAEGRPVYAHSLVLAAASSVFRDLLVQEREHVVTLDGFTYDAVKSVVDFLYSGDSSIFLANSSNLPAFLETASLFGINHTLQDGVILTQKKSSDGVVTDYLLPDSICEPALSLSASDEGSEDESDDQNDVDMPEEKPELENIEGKPEISITKKQMPVLSRRGSIKDKAKFEFCPCCKAVFRRQEAFICHIESTHTKKSGHKDDKIYVCSICSMALTNIDDFREHLASHTQRVERKHHVCTICQNSYRKKWTLQSHMRSHTGELVKCPLCPYATVYSSNVKKHMRRMHPTEMLAEAEAEERAEQAKAANGKGKPSTGGEITAQNPGTRTCKYCLKTFETQQHMASHVYHVHMRPT